MDKCNLMESYGFEKVLIYNEHDDEAWHGVLTEISGGRATLESSRVIQRLHPGGLWGSLAVDETFTGEMKDQAHLFEQKFGPQTIVNVCLLHRDIVVWGPGLPNVSGRLDLLIQQVQKEKGDRDAIGVS